MDLKNILLKRLEEETIYEDAYGLKEVKEVIEEVFKEAETKQLRIGGVSGSCPQEVAENIVTELDAFGRKINSVEYGLPIVDWDEKYEKCLQIVKDNYR